LWGYRPTAPDLHQGQADREQKWTKHYARRTENDHSADDRNEGEYRMHPKLVADQKKSEQRHFVEAARMYGLAREDWHNLANAIVGEYTEFSQMYAKMAERAEAAGDKEIAKSLREIPAEEAKHHREFRVALSKSLKPD
jgi:rubrerythrin